MAPSLLLANRSVGLWGTCALAALAGACVSGDRSAPVGPRRSVSGGVGGATGPGTGGASGMGADQAWLAKIGVGAAQTAKVCARGSRDPVAQALCRDSAPVIGGLDDLYDALGLAASGGQRLIAATTHSLGLSGRVVSALNPRTFVFRKYASLDPSSIVAVAFSRGEPFVELVGFDPVAGDFNFYLLAFQPACGGGRCAPSDVLTPKFETGWTGWTLYRDWDLEDTGLDCLSCHQPDGTLAPKRLLMRQLTGPWMHWGDFRGVSGALSCENAPVGSVVGTIVADGLDLLKQVDGPDGVHAAIPVTELVAAPGAYDFSSFQFYSVGLVDGPGNVLCEAPDCPFWEPHIFDSQNVLCDRLLHGRGDSPDGTWARYRAAMLPLGLPTPYHGPDILDSAKRADAAADFPAFVVRNAEADAFDLMAGLMSTEAARDVGFIPSETDSAENILQQMCVRCHGAGTDSRLGRAGFNAKSLDTLRPETARNIRERISLPRNSPELMPPLRAGELPAWAIARISAWTSSR